MRQKRREAIRQHVVARNSDRDERVAKRIHAHESKKKVSNTQLSDQVGSRRSRITPGLLLASPRAPVGWSPVISLKPKFVPAAGWIQKTKLCGICKQPISLKRFARHQERIHGIIPSASTINSPKEVRKVETSKVTERILPVAPRVSLAKNEIDREIEHRFCLPCGKYFESNIFLRHRREMHNMSR
jgi:hypothetical protein